MNTPIRISRGTHSENFGWFLPVPSPATRHRSVSGVALGISSAKQKVTGCLRSEKLEILTVEFNSFSELVRLTPSASTPDEKTGKDS
jgi:hypothetical protein